MSNYVSEAELLARYNYFDTASADNNNNDLLYYSQVEVVGRLSTHFDITAGHPTVKDLIIDMANAKAGKVADRADNYKAVVARIEDIKKGNEFIYTGSSTTIEPSVGVDVIWSNTMDYHPVHSMLDAEDSFVSSDRLDDLEDIRGI